MTFSARSFSELCNAVALSMSSWAHRPRGAVPLIGRVTRLPATYSKKSSGDPHLTTHLSVSMKAW